MFDVDEKFEIVAETPWDVWYENIVAYWEEHGHCFIPRLYKTPDGLLLWYWVVKMREDWKEGLVPDDQVEKMNAIEFVWYPQDDMWERGFLELQAYKRIYGDCLVPFEFEAKSNHRLGLWVREQCYFDGNYPREKSRRLRELGFVRDLHAYPDDDYDPIPLSER